jgi:hypothetical protein
MIDYPFWDSQDELTLDQAAWLWLDREPELNFAARDAKYLAINNMLYEKIKGGGLPARNTNTSLGGVHCPGETYIRRDDLKKFAESQGVKPKFLFPESRLPKSDDKAVPSDTKSKSLNDSDNQYIDSIDGSITRRERTMLKILLGMAIDGYGYDPNSSKNLLTGKNRMGLEERLTNIGLSVNSDTIRKYLTEAANLYPHVKPRKS